LKTHLLERLEGFSPGTQSYTSAQLNHLVFPGNFIYQHKYIRVNYTTYDLQRAQDSINPRTHPDVMVLAGGDNGGDRESSDHPYLYARVLGIYHADVHWHDRKSGASRHHTSMTTMDFLWVRWFIHDTKYPFRLGNKRLPRLEFATDGAFGFLDPDLVIRGCHLIPAYAHGQVSRLGKSIIHRKVDAGLDWKYHYVNMWV
jgi:hypothetical protein